MNISVCGCHSKNRSKFILMKTKHPVHIVVFGVVTSDSDVILAFIFPHGLRFNTSLKEEEPHGLRLFKCLEVVVLLWIENVAAGRCLVWQKDCVSWCMRRKIQAWMWKNFYDHVSPQNFLPNSQHINSLYY